MEFGQIDESSRKILIVDDDPSMARLIGMALAAQGYEVYEALNGIRGYKVARQEQPDLVLLDIMMPDIDGYEVFRRIKLDPATQKIPVVFVSSKFNNEDIEKGMEMGATAYITKPFDLSCLLDAVDEAIE